MIQLEAERDALQRELTELESAETPDLPDAATLAAGYRRIMENLLTLADPGEYPEGGVREAIRDTIERIVVTPNSDGSALDAVMIGQFAGIVRLWRDADTQEPASLGEAGSATSLVARAGFEPAASRL